MLGSGGLRLYRYLRSDRRASKKLSKARPFRVMRPATTVALKELLPKDLELWHVGTLLVSRPNTSRFVAKTAMPLLNRPSARSCR